MKSMTGFGRSSNRKTTAPDTESAVDLEISIKAVNGRYLDLRFHIPREYAALEGEFKTVLQSQFTRGTIDIYINRARASRALPAVRVNEETALRWINAYRQLGKMLPSAFAGGANEPTVEMLSRIPEIFQVDDTTEVSEVERTLAKALMAAAAEACCAERTREGRALQEELARLCARLEALAADAENLKVDAKAELEKRLRERLGEQLQKLGFDGKVDDQRLAQELVIYLDRADINEELQRLKEHIKAYRALLQSEVPQGKKLDFYAQELLREVNTIGSKSHISRLTAVVVEAKTVVERIREQVQNVE